MKNTKIYLQNQGLAKLIVALSLSVLLIGCQTKSHRKTPPVPKKPETTDFSSKKIDTTYIIHESFCFPVHKFCTHDSIVFLSPYIPENSPQIDFKLFKEHFVTIDSFKTNNIYPIDLSISNKDSIINGVINMLETQDKFISLVNTRNNNFHDDFLDSLKIYTNYYFDYSIKNQVSVSDTIKYCNHNNSKTGEVVVINLDLSINGNDNLNRIELDYIETVTQNYTKYRYKNPKSNCKNIDIDLSFTVYNRKLSGRPDFLPEIWNIVYYLKQQ